MDWLHLAQFRDFVYTVMNFRVPQYPGNFMTDFQE
jgi:hypothetical protein